MKRIRKEPQETKNMPQIGSHLTLEERIEILANLIVDRVIEDQKKGITHIEKI